MQEIQYHITQAILNASPTSAAPQQTRREINKMHSLAMGIKRDAHLLFGPFFQLACFAILRFAETRFAPHV